MPEGDAVSGRRTKIPLILSKGVVISLGNNITWILLLSDILAHLYIPKEVFSSIEHFG